MANFGSNNFTTPYAWGNLCQTETPCTDPNNVVMCSSNSANAGQCTDLNRALSVCGPANYCVGLNSSGIPSCNTSKSPNPQKKITKITVSQPPYSSGASVTGYITNTDAKMTKYNFYSGSGDLDYKCGHGLSTADCCTGGTSVPSPTQRSVYSLLSQVPYDQTMLYCDECTANTCDAYAGCIESTNTCPFEGFLVTRPGDWEYNLGDTAVGMNNWGTSLNVLCGYTMSSISDVQGLCNADTTSVLPVDFKQGLFSRFLVDYVLDIVSQALFVSGATGDDVGAVQEVVYNPDFFELDDAKFQSAIGTVIWIGTPGQVSTCITNIAQLQTDIVSNLTLPTMTITNNVVQVTVNICNSFLTSYRQNKTLFLQNAFAQMLTDNDSNNYIFDTKHNTYPKIPLTTVDSSFSFVEAEWYQTLTYLSTSYLCGLTVTFQVLTFSLGLFAYCVSLSTGVNVFDWTTEFCDTFSAQSVLYPIYGPVQPGTLGDPNTGTIGAFCSISLNYINSSSINDYFFCYENVGCNCWNSTDQPYETYSPGTAAAMCFSTSCEGGDVDSGGVDLSDAACVQECVTMEQWIVDQGTGAAHQINFSTFDQQKFNRLCGEQGTLFPVGGVIFVNIILPLVITGLVVCLLLGFLVDWRASVVVAVLLAAFTVFESFDFQAVKSCLDTEPLCKTSMTGISVPSVFCSDRSGCSCILNADCTTNLCVSGYCLTQS